MNNGFCIYEHGPHWVVAKSLEAAKQFLKDELDLEDEDVSEMEEISMLAYTQLEYLYDLEDIDNGHKETFSERLKKVVPRLIENNQEADLFATCLSEL